MIERRLGAGGMGVVYEALDEQRGERVALKTLGEVDGASVYRLKKEFRALTDLVHPNILRLHELFSDPRVGWFFTMARVIGVPFIAHVRGEEVHEKQLRSALIELAAGVDAIHRSGKIHRDLKPANVLVAADGHVTILDFGLAESAAHDIDKSVELAGTPAYMAPEQLAAGGGGPASDWYAIGVMIFEALTGELPFSGSTHEILATKIAGVPPKELPEVPTSLRDLAELAQSLMRSRPEDRPERDEILERLGSKKVEVSTRSEPPRQSRFVGRASELARLRAAYDEMRRGATKVVWVEGASGIGKTALVEHFTNELRYGGASSETLLLSGRCYERESVPFKAVDAVVDALSRHLCRLDPVSAARMTPRGLDELCRVFPVLDRVPAFAEAARKSHTADPEEARYRAFVALKELFARIADERPIVITIDDLQWGDPDSGLVLDVLTSPPDAPPMLLVGTYRDADIERAPLLSLLQRGKRENVDTIVVLPLDATDSAELARTHGATDSAHAVRIASESGGSPFFITELSRADVSTTSVADVITARVARLPTPARELIEVLAIAGGRLEKNVLLSAAGLDAHADDALPLLRSKSLLRASGETLETYHDRIREVVAHNVPRERARSIHGAIADALTSQPDASPDALYTHCMGAGRKSEAREHARNAAKRAQENLAFDLAARHWENVLALTEGDDRRAVEARVGDALASSGRGAAAAEAFLRAAKSAPPNESVELERRAAFELVTSGHLESGLVMSRSVASRVGIWIPKSVRLQFLLGVLGFLYLYLRGVPSRRRAEAEIDADVLRKIDVGQSFATALLMVETLRSMAFGGSSLIRALRAGEPRRIATSLMHACWMVGGVSSGTVVPWLAELRKIANELDDPKLHGHTALGEGGYEFLRGHWKRAVECLRDATAHYAKSSSVTAESSYARALETYALFYLGEYRACSDISLAAEREARARGNRWLVASVVSALGHISSLRGDAPDEASRVVSDAMRELRGYTFQEYWFGLARTLQASYRGEPALAAEVLEKLEDTLRRAGLLNVHIHRDQLFYLRGIARAAAAKMPGVEDSRRRELLSLSSRDARALRKVPMDAARAHADLVDACIAHAGDNRELAVAGLRRAIETLTAAEMLGWAAAARLHLGRLLDGEDGDALEREGRTFFENEGVVSPDRFARMLVPGFD